MKKLNPILIALILFVLLNIQEITAQIVENQVAQKHPEIEGVYEFQLGQRTMIVQFYFKDGALHHFATGNTESTKWDPVDTSGVKFITVHPEQGTFQLEFLKDDQNRYTKFRLVNEEAKLDVIGMKLKYPIEYFKKNVPTKEQIIELKFPKTACNDSAASNRPPSIATVRRISEQYATGGLYLMTQCGDYENLFQKENQKAIDHPIINESWRYCSIFSTRSGDSVFAGKNWDNQNVGSIIVSLYKPQNGYSSISFSRAIDLGFPLNVDIQDFKSTTLGNKLLLAPFYAYDGFNEHGVFASVTGINKVRVTPINGKESICISYLVRKILDHTKSIQEVLDLIERYVPFDLDKNSLNCHFFIADASGKSVILEYQQNEWRKIPSEKSWQVMTNKVIYNVADSTLRKDCSRYRTLSETLERRDGEIDWRMGMEMLRAVSQAGTTWSVVYSLRSQDVFFSVYQTWEKIYHIEGFLEFSKSKK